MMYVVTNPENGWDCVLGVFTTLKLAVEFCGFEYIEGKHYYNYASDTQIIHEVKVDKTPN